jgi:hypothetical protein
MDTKQLIEHHYGVRQADGTIIYKVEYLDPDNIVIKTQEERKVEELQALIDKLTNNG